MAGRVKLFFDPQSRAAMARWVLEEVGADYEIVPVAIRSGESRTPEFLALNPMGKLPTLQLADGTVVTEAPAVIAWAADAYPQAGLAPAPGSSERGSYYRWLFFGNGSFEPAMTEAMMRRGAEPLPRGTVGWGSYDDVVDTVEGALGKAPFLLGERFSAADLYIASQLGFGSMFGAPRLKESAAIQDYIRRCTDRDGWRRANKS